MDNSKKIRLTYVGMGVLLHNMIAIFLFLVTSALSRSIPNWLNILLVITIYLISFVVPFFFIAFKYPLRIKEERLIERRVPTGIIYSSFAIMGLSYIAQRLGMLITSALSHFSIVESTGKTDFTSDTASFILYFLFMVIIVPIVEEIFYRGVILQTLMPFGNGPALIFTTLFFALSHSGTAGILYAFVSGLFIGALVIRYKSLKVGIIAHFINNFITFILTVSMDYTGELGERIISFVFPLVAVLCGIWWFFTFGRYLLKLSKGEKYHKILLFPPVLMFFVVAVYIFVSSFNKI